MMNELKAMNMHSIRRPHSSWPSHQFLIVTTVVVCLLADAFAYGMTLPVLPSLFARVGVLEKDFQVLSSTIVSIHAGSSMFFFPVAGLIVHHAKTRKAPMLIGLGVFTVVSITLKTGSVLPLRNQRCVHSD
jgi:hypothetical protein